MNPQDLMSDEYRNVLEQYHQDAKDWGRNAGEKRAPLIHRLVKKYKTKNILDYGSGKGSLNEAVQAYKIVSYEPGIPELANLPKPYDIVVSFGVLEHVEPEYIDNVVAYLDIGTLPAKHVLSDGRNAHLIVENKDWWLEKLKRAGFNVKSATPNFNEEGDHSIRLDKQKGKGCIMFVCEPI